MDNHSIPILMFHNVADGSVNHRYTIALDEMEKMLLYLRQNGCRTRTIDEADGTNFKDVLLTFDDSYVSYYAVIFPLLKQHNQKAVFFVTTDWLEKDERYLSWQQLKEMKDGGMQIQSHTCSHRFLDDLSKEEIRKELIVSKKVIEEHLSCGVDYFSCPGGRFNENVIEIAKELGYKGMFTSVPGYGFKENEGFRIFNRMIVKDGTHFPGILSLNKFKLVLNRAEYCAKSLLKRIIGNKSYYEVWKRQNSV